MMLQLGALLTSYMPFGALLTSCMPVAYRKLHLILEEFLTSYIPTAAYVQQQVGGGHTRDTATRDTSHSYVSHPSHVTHMKDSSNSGVAIRSRMQVM